MHKLLLNIPTQLDTRRLTIRKYTEGDGRARSLEFLFSDLDAHKVIVITRDTNIRSFRLAERLGFRREGHLRESGIEDGRRYGLLHYRMLKSEFSSTQVYAAKAPPKPKRPR